MAYDGRLTFDTKLDTKGFEEGKEKIEEEAKELDKQLDVNAEINVDVSADTSQAEQAVNEVAQAVEAVPDKEVSVAVDTSQVEPAAAEMAQEVDTIPDAEITVTADAEPVDEVSAQINDDIEDVHNTAENTADSVSSGVKSAAKTAEKRVDNSTSHISDSLKKVQSGFKKLLAAAGLLVGTGAAIKIGKQAVEAAADVNAANSQLSQTFAELEGNATAAMKKVADASGIVQTRLQGVGTSIYAFARTTGMDTTQALGMMEDALQVAADSAAYYDRSLEDTSETLLSFLKGNYANDAALGLSATETTRNIAANKLYGKSFQELSEAQKQLTLLQMVKDANQLSGAMGQAAREANGWANVVGNLKEAWKQLIAVIGQPLLNVAVTWVQKLTDALTLLTEKAKIVINTLGKVFGFEIGSSSEVADNISQSVASQEELTGAVEDTAEAEKKSLAGFDKINTVNSNTADTAQKSGGSSAAATTTAPADIKIKDNTLEVSERLEKFLTKTRNIFGTITKFLKETFIPNFKKYATQTYTESVRIGKQLLSYFKTNLLPSLKKAWAGLEPQIKQFGLNWKEVFKDIKELGPPLTNYLNGDFTSLIQTFVETSGKILSGLFESFNTVFSDLWNVAAYPILQSFIETGLPMISQFAEESIKSFGTLFDEVKGGFDTIWKEAAVPSLSEIAKIWKDTMLIFSDFWDKHGKKVFEKFRTAIEKTGEVLSKVWDTIIKPVLDKMGTALDKLWDEHGKKLLKNFLDFAGTLADLALDIYNNFIAPVVGWFVETFGPAIAKVLGDLATSFGDKIGGIMDILSNLLNLLKNVLNFVKNVFKGDWKEAWGDIKKAFESFWNLVESIVKIPLNAAIGLINKFIDGIETAMNYLIDAINSISIDLPEIGPFGGGHIGFDLDSVSFKPIPALAQGTVIPANYGNFLAMLGDNKRETEVVSPLSTMEKAMENVLARRGNSDKPIIVQCILDGREIGRVAVKAVADDNRRKGA